MTTIHAYRRTKPYTHTFPDVTLKFLPNEAGDVVCDVASESAVDRLLAVPTGFKLYAPQPTQVQEAVIGILGAAVGLPGTVATEVASAAVRLDKGEGQEPAGDTMDREKYILVNGDTRFDLNPLGDEQLRDFAKVNGIKVHHAAKGDTIRDAIVKALKIADEADGAGESAAGSQEATGAVEQQAAGGNEAAGEAAKQG